MNNPELLNTSLDIEKVMSQVTNKNRMDSTQIILSRKRGRNERDKEIIIEREISGMYKCPGCLMLYETKSELDTHWYGSCERVSVGGRLGYTIGSSVDSEFDSDSESENDSETGGENRLSLTNTRRNDDDYQDIKCEGCNQYFACFQQLDTHYYDYHTPFVQTPLMTSSGVSLVTIPRNHYYKFKCPICFVSFKSASNIKSHLMDVCSMSSQKDKQCTKCLDCFADTDKLKDHIKAFHEPEIEVECSSATESSSSSPLSSLSSSSPSSSPISSSSTTSTSSSVTKRNVIRDDKNKFNCPICSCRFTSTVGIRHHAYTSCQWKELHIDDYNQISRKRICISSALSSSSSLSSSS